jgi:hypothetical protein
MAHMRPSMTWNQVRLHGAVAAGLHVVMGEKWVEQQACCLLCFDVHLLCCVVTRRQPSAGRVQLLWMQSSVLVTTAWNVDLCVHFVCVCFAAALHMTHRGCGDAAVGCNTYFTSDYRACMPLLTTSTWRWTDTYAVLCRAVVCR